MNRIYIILLLFIILFASCSNQDNCRQALELDSAIIHHAEDYLAIAKELTVNRAKLVAAFAEKHHGDSSEVYGSLKVMENYLPGKRSDAWDNLSQLNTVKITYRPDSARVRFDIYQYSCGDSIVTHFVTNRNTAEPAAPKTVPLPGNWYYHIQKEAESGSY